MSWSPTRPRIDWKTQAWCSFLFAPGNDRRKLAKLGSLPSDVIVLDLEDAVAESAKDDARGLVADTIEAYATQAVVAVRVNSYETGRLEEDVRSVFQPRLDCVVMSKVERVGEVQHVAEVLTECEQRRSVAGPSVRLIATIESAAGVLECDKIAASSPRMVGLIFGVVDFSRELGIEPTPAGEAFLLARTRVVIAARAARLPAAIDGPYLALDDVEGLTRDSQRSRSLGFQGRVVLHPNQVAAVQGAYGSLPGEVLMRYRRIVDAFEKAEKGGLASLRVGGEFVDYPVYRRAKEQLDRYVDSSGGADD